MSSTQQRQLELLKLHITDFAKFSAATCVLAEMAPDRMSLSQAIFFVLTVNADLAGWRPTFSEIKADVGDTVNKSLHTTYRVLLEPNLNYPKGLGRKLINALRIAGLRDSGASRLGFDGTAAV